MRPLAQHPYPLNLSSADSSNWPCRNFFLRTWVKLLHTPFFSIPPFPLRLSTQPPRESEGTSNNGPHRQPLGLISALSPASRLGKHLSIEQSPSPAVSPRVQSNIALVSALSSPALAAAPWSRTTLPHPLTSQLPHPTPSPSPPHPHRPQCLPELYVALPIPRRDPLRAGPVAPFSTAQANLVLPSHPSSLATPAIPPPPQQLSRRR